MNIEEPKERGLIDTLPLDEDCFRFAMDEANRAFENEGEDEEQARAAIRGYLYAFGVKHRSTVLAAKSGIEDDFNNDITPYDHDRPRNADRGTTRKSAERDGYGRKVFTPEPDTRVYTADDVEHTLQRDPAYLRVLLGARGVNVDTQDRVRVMGIAHDEQDNSYFLQCSREKDGVRVIVSTLKFYRLKTGE